MFSHIGLQKIEMKIQDTIIKYLKAGKIIIQSYLLTVLLLPVRCSVPSRQSGTK